MLDAVQREAKLRKALEDLIEFIDVNFADEAHFEVMEAAEIVAAREALAS